MERNKCFAAQCQCISSRQALKAQMMLGKAFPISKAQAMEFVRMGCSMAEMNSEDVGIIERLLGKYHMTGEYRYVGDKRHVKLINQMDLDKAVKLEYDF